jgi:hypothetical protein
MVTMTWNKITTPYTFRRYRIFGGTTDNPTTQIDSTLAGQISDTSITLSNLIHGQIYYFRIKGVIEPGCAGDFSAAVNLIVKTGVIPQVKSKWGSLLIAYNKGDSISSFQWYNGTNPISGATKQYYLTKQPGEYHVQSVDIFGCQNISNKITAGTASLTVYPNPAAERLTLTVRCKSTGKAIVRIINSSGTRILEYQVDKEDTELIKELDIQSLQSGIYSVEVLVDNEEKLDTRLVVIK